MKQAILFHQITGYVTILVEGYAIEKFINLVKVKGIFLWDIARPKNTIMEAKIGMKDFKKIRPIARKTKCRVKLEKKKGIPFVIKKYRKRKVFAIFLGIVCCFVWVLSGFIWNIGIEGNENIASEEILNLVASYGVEEGMPKSKIDQNQIIQNLRKQREDIAWVGLETKGTNLTIKIVEASQKPEMIPEDEYCQIIATKEGMIQRIQAQNGTIAKEVGDFVKPGDIVIKR